MFKIGEYAVCPGHGVGQICDIEHRELDGQSIYFYVIKILANGMTVMVSTESENGVRRLIDEEGINAVYGLLEDQDVEVDNSTWNRRQRDYMTKVKTGSLLEIADVLRALFILKEKKERDKKTLSFSEKKMLELCRDLIGQEISLASGKDLKEINSQINGFFE